MKFLLICLGVLVITACSTEPLKAPCDHYATFCGNKTKINRW